MKSVKIRQKTQEIVLTYWHSKHIFDRESEARGPKSLIIVVVVLVVVLVGILKCSVMLSR